MRFTFACLCLMTSFCGGQGFTINTVAGDGVQGFTGDSGLAINAELSLSLAWRSITPAPFTSPIREIAGSEKWRRMA